MTPAEVYEVVFTIGGRPPLTFRVTASSSYMAELLARERLAKSDPANAWSARRASVRVVHEEA